MSFSPGTRSLFGEVTTWIIVAGIGAAALTHYSELKVLIGDGLGLAPPAAEQQADGAANTNVAPPTNSQGGFVVELKAGDHGHFNTRAEVNGADIDVMVDTGASMVALPYEDAERAGIYIRDSDYTGYVSTANGRARVAPVTLGSVSIGNITVRNVEAVVSEPGALQVTLLGMTFLSRLDRVDMRSGVLILED